MAKVLSAIRTELKNEQSGSLKSGHIIPYRNKYEFLILFR
jgi:hypothetical protein